MRTIFLILFFAATLIGCGGKNPKDEATLAEARKVHNEANKLHKEVMKDNTKLKEYAQKLKDSLQNISKKPNFKEADAKPLKDLITKCEAQNLEMAQWMKEIREVPGNEDAHDHHDHEGHDHSHEAAPQVSPAEMLAYQKEMKKKLEKIQQDINAILAK